MHSKGLELAAYEPRRAVGQGLGYAVANRGGCHLNAGYLVILEGLGLNIDTQTPKAKADFTMMFQNLMETISATGQCLFTSYAFFPGFLLTNPNGFITQTINYLLEHNIKPMFWADIILQGSQEVLNDIPKESIALNWGYERWEVTEDSCIRMEKTGVPYDNIYNFLKGEMQSWKKTALIAGHRPTCPRHRRCPRSSRSPRSSLR